MKSRKSTTPQTTPPPATPRVFAIVPAAGHSRRMGRHKLLLPWGRSTVIETVLAAWTQSRVDQVVVVARKDDSGLHARCELFGADLVLPDKDPDDMRVSVELALQYIGEKYRPELSDAWMLSPADLPQLSGTLIDRIIASRLESDQTHNPPSITVPGNPEKRGHPVLFSWSLADEVCSLDGDAGINSLLTRHQIRFLNLGSSVAFRDLDTPEDYDALRRAQGDVQPTALPESENEDRN